MVRDRIQKSIFWLPGKLTTIYEEWELGTLRGARTQLFCLICFTLEMAPFELVT